MSKIIITGSSGVIGKFVTSELKNRGHELILIDKNDNENPVDLLKDDLNKYFSSAEILIHLAAHPRADINKELAEENLEMCRRVIRACNESDSIRKIINASSINVYPYFEIYERKETITSLTPLSPNLYFPPGEYARAKIQAEHMFDDFCTARNISLTHLRFGHVTVDGIIPTAKIAWQNDIEKKIFLKPEHVKEIISYSLQLEGKHQFLCVSEKSWLADDSIRFPLELD